MEIPRNDDRHALHAPRISGIAQRRVHFPAFLSLPSTIENVSRNTKYSRLVILNYCNASKSRSYINQQDRVRAGNFLFSPISGDLYKYVN